ncbi:MAG: hypothetical protein HOO01_01635, partial [Cellvibrionales bacterium]|nr:hypothetical protein [Cellvibrionales bacterium]
MSIFAQQLAKICSDNGFIAALDQSGWTQATPANVTGQVVQVELDGIGSLDSNGALALTRWL